MDSLQLVLGIYKLIFKPCKYSTGIVTATVDSAGLVIITITSWWDWL